MLAQTDDIGADGVIITASSKTNDIIHQAAQMSRKRGRIVLVGVIGLDIQRADFYEKELSFQVSCSYGPGRYDDTYEQKGQDYPIGFVRWTEKRNFEAVLEALRTGALEVKPLITERVPLEGFDNIYRDMRKEGSIASILEYPVDAASATLVAIPDVTLSPSSATIGIIGAGNFTSSTIIPVLKPLEANIKYIASAGGLNAKILAKKSGAAYAASDYKEILNDPEVNLVLITTRHNLHAPMALEALKAGKTRVFVEKPLCLTKRNWKKSAIWQRSTKKWSW